MLSNGKAAFKFLLLFVWMGVWFIFLTLAYRLRKYTLRDHVMRLSSAGILWIIGVRVNVTGVPGAERPLLLVSNHVSYLDVLILNSKAHIHFTPKIEIDGWPFMKSVARMSGSVYVERRADKISDGRDKLAVALEKGDMVCLFPEATTGSGLHLLPFKSSFFSLAEQAIGGRELTVQPVALTYTAIRRLPIDTTQWPHVAWYGDMSMLPHLWNLLKLTPLTAELAFLSPTTLRQHGDRKKLAAHCRLVIEEAIQTIRH